MRIVARTGESRYWMYRNVLSKDQSGADYVLGHAIDITERRAAEERQQRLLQIERNARRVIPIPPRQEIPILGPGPRARSARFHAATLLVSARR